MSDIVPAPSRLQAIRYSLGRQIRTLSDLEARATAPFVCPALFKPTWRSKNHETVKAVKGNNPDFGRSSFAILCATIIVPALGGTVGAAFGVNDGRP